MLPLRVISPFCFHWLPYKYNWPPFSNFLAPNNFSGCEEKSAVRPNPIANVKGTSEEPQRVNYTVGMELNQTSLLYCWNPKYAYVGGTHWSLDIGCLSTHYANVGVYPLIQHFPQLMGTCRTWGLQVRPKRSNFPNLSSLIAWRSCIILKQTTTD